VIISTVRQIYTRAAVSEDINGMGGVEYAVPIGIAILLYFLLPAYINNRQHRLVDRIREEYHPTIIRIEGVRLAGRWLRFPAVLAVTSEYLIIRNALSLYPDETPLERLRGITIQRQISENIPEPGNILIITTTEHTYRIIFERPEGAAEWRAEIERAI
jgi:hypothetical protein